MTTATDAPDVDIGAARTVPELLEVVASTDAERDAFVEPAVGDRSRRAVTFAELRRLSAVGAAHLAERGVRPGDVVAIRLPNGIDYAVAYHSILRLGAIATGINPRLGPHEIEHIRAIAAPACVVDEALPRDGREHPATHGTADDAAVIVWTGGTTGLPKGAWFDHRCMTAMADGAGPLSRFGDRRLSPLPFSHVGFMTRAWDELSQRITTIVAPMPWSAATTLRVLVDERVTVSQGVPTQYQLLLDLEALDHADLSALRACGIGAARAQPELIAALQQRLGVPVIHRYASTEASLATGTRLGDPVEVICGTVGRPNGDVELKIVDDAGVPLTGRDAEHGTGTICLRSRAMMRGYWNDPARTAEAIDADGWLHTGDLGWVDDDGNLHIAGRRTEMYIRGGYNVYPIEVENCLGDHPDVASCAVIGMPVADRIGEIGVGFVVARPGRAPSPAELRAFVKQRLADYKAPDTVVLVDALPLTSIGKIDKKALHPTAVEAAAHWRRR